MDDEQHQHLESLLHNNQQRLQKLEQTAAIYGINAAPEVLTEIDTLRQTVTTLKDQLGTSLKLDAIPPAVADFIGRDADMSWMIQTITQAVEQGTAAIIGIRGLGGLGKTQLALAASERLRPLFPDAQLLIRLRGAGNQPLSPAQALQVIIRATDPTAPLLEDVNALQAHYSSLLSGKHILILADDARDVGQVKPLQSPPGCALIVTSRNRFTMPGLLPLDLGTLPEGEATQLLLTICPRIGEHAGRLAELCGYLPLALRVSASLLANDDTRNIERYLARLADEHERLIQLRDPDDPELDVEASLQLSYDALDPASQNVLRRLSVFRVSFDLKAAASIVEMEEAQTEDVLGLLRRHNLLVWDSVLERYILHDLVRTFATARQDIAERDAARQRHTDYYLRMAEEAETELSGAQPTAALDRLENNQNNLRTALERSLNSGSIESAMRLSGALWMFWEVRGYLGEGRRWLEQTLAAAADSTLAPVVRAKALCGAGVLAQRQGDYARANELLEQGLALYRELDDKQGIARALTNLGWLVLDQSDFTRANMLLQEGLTLYRELGDKRGIAGALTNLGWVAPLQQQNYQPAAQFFEESLTLYRDVGDPSGIAGVLVNLAWVALAQGDVAGAASRCRESLQLHQEIGDREGIVECLMAMADVAQAQNQPEQAVRLWAAAQTEYTAIGAARSIVDDTDYKRNIDAVRSQLDEGVFAAAWADGQAMPLERVIAEILGIEGS
jgi:predicted ATPase